MSVVNSHGRRCDDRLQLPLLQPDLDHGELVAAAQGTTDGLAEAIDDLEPMMQRFLAALGRERERW